MIEGVLRHDTEMDVEKQYVDTHGQSEVGFAFCHLLGFELLPRLKNLKKQRLYSDRGRGLVQIIHGECWIEQAWVLCVDFLK
jgi:TnpA family transposase